MPPGMQMERPPMPPEVAAQMGGAGGGKPPFAQVGGMLGDKQAAGNPLKAAIDMTEKLWTNVVKASPTMGPFVERAMSILKAGLEDTAKAKPGGAAPPPGADAEGGPPPQGAGPGQMPA